MAPLFLNLVLVEINNLLQVPESSISRGKSTYSRCVGGLVSSISSLDISGVSDLCGYSKPNRSESSLLTPEHAIPLSL